MGTPEHPFLSDEFVAAEIARALAPFQDELDPEEIAWMRDALAAELEEDAELQALLSAVHPASVNGSGERLKPWLALERTDDADEKVS